MFKILLLDDESVIVDGVYQYLINARADKYEIFQAYNAHDALRILENKRIDVLLTDIQMPGIDGISLHNLIIKKHQHCRTIFFTAHNDFEYAYYTAKYKDAKILLKSEGYQEMLKIIDQTVDEIKIELAYDGSPFQRDEDEYIMCKQSESFLELMTGWDKDNADEQIKKFAEKNDITIDWLDKIYPVLLLVDEKTEHIEKTNLCSIIHYLKHQFSNYYNVRYIYTKKNELLLLFQGKATSLQDEDASNIDENLELIHTTICELVNENVCIGESDNICACSDIVFKYNGMKKLIENYNVDGNELICKINPYGISSEQELEKIGKIILKNMIDFDYEMLDEMLGKFINICSKMNMNEKAIKHNIISILYKYIRLNRLLGSDIICDSINDIINTHGDMLASENILKSVCNIVGENVENRKSEIYFNDNVDNIILSIDNYIRNNYHKDISLSDVATNVYLSPAYVSRIYKKVRGINVVSKIHQVRLEQSIYYLKKTNMKINDISAQVGFNSYRYFNTLFKKWKGVTPIVFRENPID